MDEGWRGDISFKLDVGALPRCFLSSAVKRPFDFFKASLHRKPGQKRFVSQRGLKDEERRKGRYLVKKKRREK